MSVNHTDTDPKATPPVEADAEFGPDAAELELDGVSRRKFLGTMGASAALAGVGLQGCIRKEVEHLVPYSRRPEDRIPGKPVYYATAYQVGLSVMGLVVENQDGRPTKIEGNPQHPNSRGATNVWAQASVLDLYDPERSQRPSLVTQGEAGEARSRSWEDVDWARAWQVFDTVIANARAKRGKGVAIVMESVTSPTLKAQLATLRRAMPDARLFLSDPMYPANTMAGAALASGPAAYPVYELDKADVVLALDSDFLGREGDAVRHAKGFSAKRRVVQPTDPMNRLYSVEPNFSLTGATADHRLRLRGRDVGTFLKALAHTLFTKHGISAPSGAGALTASIAGIAFDERSTKFIDALAKDLAANRGKSMLIVGERQPAWVHGLAHLVNAALGATGQTVTWLADPTSVALEDEAALAEALRSGQIDTIVNIGSNPIHTAPVDLGLGELWGKARTQIHLGLRFDETAKISNVHLPLSHYLEAWGDQQAQDGTVSIQQPLINPLYYTPSVLEVVTRMATGKPANGLELVKTHWKNRTSGPGFEKTWRRWLHTGVVDGAPRLPSPRAQRWTAVAQAVASAAPVQADARLFEVDFHIDPCLMDGRFANNGWLQELPDPMTKLTWDNAALISLATSEQLGVSNGDFVTVEVAGRKLKLPAFVAPGQADQTVSITLGYGRSEAGSIAMGAGFDAYALRTSGAPWIAANAIVTPAGGSYPLADVQPWDSLTPATVHSSLDVADSSWSRRPLVRVGERRTLMGQTGWVPAHRKNPEAPLQLDEDFVEQDELVPKWKIKSLSDPPQLTGAQQWGMTIDLNTCIGCNACLMACVSENNTPVVGKSRVIKGREMHWIRLDRYYEGDMNDPTAVLQPLPCMQCENAPCETVCPVAATTHSPEGLNDMAYNRCIGTRYCSNNCPYKVRKFNFFNYNLDIHPVLQMQKNPDVTVRFRGVMEKCTYCVQRINEAKIDAKVHGDGIVPDIDDPNAKTATIVTACQQVCPTDSIVFGDVKNPNSRVSKRKAEPRDYAMLGELNTKPRTSYLATIRNPNPDLG